jgi:hypothetical protein
MSVPRAQLEIFGVGTAFCILSKKPFEDFDSQTIDKWEVMPAWSGYPGLRGEGQAYWCSIFPNFNILLKKDLKVQLPR